MTTDATVYRLAAEQEELRARIRALTPAQMREALMYLTGWTHTGTVHAIDHALVSSPVTCPECGGTGSAPTHRITCTRYEGRTP